MANVLATHGTGGPPWGTATTWTSTGAAADHLLKEITEAIKLRVATATSGPTEDLFKVEPVETGGTATTSSTRIESGAANFFEIGPIAIVRSSFFFVAQNVIGFLNSLEFLVRGFVIRVFVRVIFDRQLAMSFLDVVLGCRSVNTQGLIEVFCHRNGFVVEFG